MSKHIQSLNSIIDSMIIRMDNSVDLGEYQALHKALDILESYMSREARLINIVDAIQQRIEEME